MYAMATYLIRNAFQRLPCWILQGFSLQPLHLSSFFPLKENGLEHSEQLCTLYFINSSSMIYKIKLRKYRQYPEACRTVSGRSQEAVHYHTVYYTKGNTYFYDVKVEFWVFENVVYSTAPPPPCHFLLVLKRFLQFWIIYKIKVPWGHSDRICSAHYGSVLSHGAWASPVFQTAAVQAERGYWLQSSAVSGRRRPQTMNLLQVYR